MSGLPAPVRHVVVMGVCGCGKSTVGELLAAGLGVPFTDGDALHPEANIAKMAAGTPLDDDDRQPWLEAVGDALAGSGNGLVVACSALKRSYRDTIRSRAPETVFIHLSGSRALLASRLDARSGHFMPPTLLDSQLAALEPPAAGERAVVLDIAAPAPQLAAAALERLTGLRG